MFQFQHGAIGRTWIDWVINAQTWFQFQHGAIGSFLYSSGKCASYLFQFQHGAIGSSIEKLELLVGRNCFNSSMVRLGEHVWCVMDDNAEKFQFQHGAIGSILFWIPISRLYGVSIPAWCDWELTGETGLLLVGTTFQFQHGAIGRPSDMKVTIDHFEVSIPAWCDWESIT